MNYNYFAIYLLLSLTTIPNMQNENCKIVVSAIRECIEKNVTVKKNLIKDSDGWKPFNFFKCSEISEINKHKYILGNVTFNFHDLTDIYFKSITVEPISTSCVGVTDIKISMDHYPYPRYVGTCNF